MRPQRRSITRVAEKYHRKEAWHVFQIWHVFQMLARFPNGTFSKAKRKVGDWLRAGEIPHILSRTLPSDQYADLSHPLAAGYAQLAAEMQEDEALRSWLEKP